MKPDVDFRLRATWWMLGAIVSFTTMAIAGRFARLDHDTFEIMFFRSILGILIVVICAWHFKTLQEINTKRLGRHALRNLAHFTGQNLWFFALPMIPLAQLFALEFTGPIWVLLLAPLFLGEKLTLQKMGFAALGFIGIMFVAQPNFNGVGIGIITAAAAAFAFALTAIFTRQLTETASITCILFHLTLMQAVFGCVTVFWDGVVTLPSATALPWLFLIGVAGLAAHFCLTKALSIAPASIVMPLDFARLPIIAFIGLVFYGESLNIWVLFGALLIFASNYLNVTRST